MSRSIFFIDLEDDDANNEKKKGAIMNGETKQQRRNSFYQEDSDDESYDSDQEKSNRTSINMSKSREGSHRFSTNAKLNNGFINE